MIYPIIGTAFGAFFFYLGSNLDQKQLQKPYIQTTKPLNSTFRDETITDYIQRRKQPNKFILYSNYHKSNLVTHLLIDAQSLKKQQMQVQQSSQLPKTQINATIQKQQNLQQILVNPSSQKQDTGPNNPKSDSSNFEAELRPLKIFSPYAKNLIKSQVCQSVQLIYGPVYSKDTPLKEDNQYVNNIYTSSITITPEGKHLTDRNFTIVICNNHKGHYYNGFTYYGSIKRNKYKLINHLTSIRKIQEQTGLAFNIKGRQLTELDYAGLSKQNLFQELHKQNVKAPPAHTQKQPQSANN